MHTYERPRGSTGSVPADYSVAAIDAIVELEHGLVVVCIHSHVQLVHFLLVGHTEAISDLVYGDMNKGK